MLTFTTFALLALSLFTTFMAITAMRREREELHKNVSTLDYVLELEKELTSLYEQRAERESLLVEKTQQIHDLQIALFESKESTNELLESYQEEIQDLEDQVKDLSQLKYVHQSEISELLTELHSYESSDAEEELKIAQECIWDKERQISELSEANQKVADTLLALSYKEKPVTPRELTELREVALRWDQIPF